MTRSRYVCIGPADRGGSHDRRAAREDPLSAALTMVRFRGVALNLVNVPGGWSFESLPTSRVRESVLPDAEHVFAFHIIIEGPCWVWLRDDRPKAVQPGDVVVLPRGDPHLVATDPRRPSRPLDSTFARVTSQELPVVIRRSGGATRTRVICGFIGCDRRPFHRLLGSLPALITIPAGDETGGSLRTLLRTTVGQLTEPQLAGTGAFVSRLTELVFLDALRRHLASPAVDHGWLAAVHDPAVGAAIAAIHRAPARRWTMAALTRVAGASRTVLTERFGRLLEETPMQYVTRWRIELAAQQLRETDDSVSAVAAAVGYASTAAFHRAFTKVIGAPPARWRDSLRRRID